MLTFLCENRHEVESVIVDLTRRPDITEEEIWQLLTKKNGSCVKCGSAVFTYRVRYKHYLGGSD